MRSLLPILAAAAACLLAVEPAAARRTIPRFCVSAGTGVHVLTADVSGDVIDTRPTALIEFGVGYQFRKNWLVDFTFGFRGQYEEDSVYVPRLEPLPDVEAAYQVRVNPLMMRTYWTPSGHREGYMKPQLSAGVGWTQVTRLLRNPPGVPPFDTSQLLFTVEGGASLLFVFTRNFSGSLGVRYLVTEQRGIVHRTDHLGGVGIVFGIRTFLPSPRDVAEPEPPTDPKPPKP